MSDRDDHSKAWKLPPSRYFASRPAEFALPLQPFSQYVAMRDSVRIAVDVYLPQGAPQGQVPGDPGGYALLPAVQDGRARG